MVNTWEVDTGEVETEEEENGDILQFETDEHGVFLELYQ